MNKQGLLTCARYAFPPNSLHYCGPEKQVNLIAYQKQQIADEGLKEIIEKFETLYPYLSLIAYENNIRDPFDPHVVEAYWIGNSLLNNVSMKLFYRHFNEALNLKKKVKKKDLELLYGKLDDGILPHHTFHVLNVFTRTGHHSIKHTIETMDNCRIAWGEIITPRHPKLDSGSTQVKTKPLILEINKLTLGKPVLKKVDIPFDYIPKSKVLNHKSYVSYHWNTLCDIITEKQAQELERYTNSAIRLANKSI